MVVVCDDEWSRRGLAQGVAEISEASLVGALRLHELHDFASWGSVDMVVVAATATADVWDRYSGVWATSFVRSMAERAQPTIVVLAESFHNPLLPLRLVEAGCDFLYQLADVRLVDDLVEIVRQPSEDQRVDVLIDAAELRSFGLTKGSRLNRGLDYIAEQDLAAVFSEASAPRVSRRRLITLRRRLSDIVGIEPVMCGSGALVMPVIPSWRQLYSVMSMARGWRSND